MTKKRVEVDHIGFRTASEKDYAAVVEALKKVGLEGEESEAPGHRRTFFDIGGDRRLEVQLWEAAMPQMRKPGVHVDVKSIDPMKTLEQVSGKAEDWGEGEIPRGGVKVTDAFMIMARPLIKK